MKMAVLKHCPGLEKACGRFALFQHVLWEDGFRFLVPDVSATNKALKTVGWLHSGLCPGTSAVWRLLVSLISLQHRQN